MKVAVLYSGGKDSNLALNYALKSKDIEVKCLITVYSKNTASYMFHTPNIHITELQAKASQIPIMIKKTEGEKELELEDLKAIIRDAIGKYKINGIFTGAVKSTYQASRIQKICDELRIKCINPLWQKSEDDIIADIERLGFKVIISGVFAYPLTKEYVGKILNKSMAEKLKKLNVSPIGEGGEIETTVLHAPFFKKEIIIQEFKIEGEGHSWNYKIKKAVLA
jgi:ABC transporter with metal-binding/Fe-S-binding domain ATP-binding protein